MAKLVRPPRAYSNAILRNLSPLSHKRLSGDLKPVSLAVNEVICEAGEAIRYVYFVEDGMVSVVAVMRDGRSIEVGTIGKEGAVGSEAILGSPAIPYRRYVQIAGGGYRIRAELVRREAEKSQAFREHLLRCQAGFFVQAMQSAACNGLHSIEQRCCRWILTARDLTNDNSIPLTHEFLAIMLAVRRASVSDVLKPLQDGNLIQSVRGILKILNRTALEKRSCECYTTIAKYQRQLQA